MPPNSAHGKLDSEETNAAAWQATRGAVTGAARWGIYSAVAAGIAYAYSPVYRGLTIQFKVYVFIFLVFSQVTSYAGGHSWHVISHFLQAHKHMLYFDMLASLSRPNMSGMIFGSVIEADERLRIYGERSRRQKVMARDAAVWRKYEEEFESLGISGIASEARAKKGSSEEQEQEK
ncbi:hypothetical protein D6D19_01232 [Aureobasidium pullulans]|uniref:Uncharacterized protein n=1 Tax=Aureobasidium pullulans TaxID=5580 RepID=A0A4S9LL11_AURPU|nr:hypothetical protein D6D19_01232 [Aureobasidium pullulans]THY29772.1 hypothetical protein D6D00_03316 [Aureobasidium pullulans]TIA26059.1 hypothetical protein D6C81_01130 [Aureobasidium pullulans]